MEAKTESHQDSDPVASEGSIPLVPSYSGSETPGSDPTDASDSVHEVCEAPPTPPPDPKPTKKTKKAMADAKKQSGGNCDQLSDAKTKKTTAKNRKRKGEALVNGDVGEQNEDMSTDVNRSDGTNHDGGKAKPKKVKKTGLDGAATKKKSSKKAPASKVPSNGESCAEECSKSVVDNAKPADVTEASSSGENESLDKLKDQNGITDQVVDNCTVATEAKDPSIGSETKDTSNVTAASSPTPELNNSALEPATPSIPQPSPSDPTDEPSKPDSDKPDSVDTSCSSSSPSCPDPVQSTATSVESVQSSTVDNQAGVVSGNEPLSVEGGLIGVPRVGRPEDLLKAQQPEEDEDSADRPFTCPHCSYKGRKKGQLRKHMAVHNVFACAHCDQICQCRKELEEHMKDNHPSRCGRKLCKKCNVLFLAHELDEHEQGCTGQKQMWDCKECGKSFKFVCALKSHVHRWHTEEGMEASKRFQCDQCEYRGTFMRDLRQHINSVHKPVDVEKKEKCTECEAMFYTKEDLKRHVRECHTKERPYVCHMCEKAFKTKTHLKNHYNTHNPSDSFKCDQEGCSSTFKAEKYLERHRVDIHKLPPRRKRTPHPCSHPGCSEIFNKKSHLKRHEATHSDERKYPCEWSDCKKTFRHADNLKVHMRRHMGEKTMKCELCDNAYYQRSGLRYHMNKAHGIRIVSSKTKQKEDAEAAARADQANSPKVSNSVEAPPGKDVYEFMDSDDEEEDIQLHPLKSPRRLEEPPPESPKQSEPESPPPTKKSKKAKNKKENGGISPKKKLTKAQIRAQEKAKLAQEESLAEKPEPESNEESEEVVEPKGKKKKAAKKKPASKKKPAAKKTTSVDDEESEMSDSEEALTTPVKAKKGRASTKRVTRNAVKKAKGKKKAKKTVVTEDSEEDEQIPEETIVSPKPDQDVPECPALTEEQKQDSSKDFAEHDSEQTEPSFQNDGSMQEQDVLNGSKDSSDTRDMLDDIKEMLEDDKDLLDEETDRMTASIEADEDHHDVDQIAAEALEESESETRNNQEEIMAQDDQQGNWSHPGSPESQPSDGEGSSDNASNLQEEFTSDMYEMPRAPAPPPMTSDDEDEVLPPHSDLAVDLGSMNQPQPAYEVSDSTTQEATPPSVAPASCSEVPPTPGERTSMEYTMQQQTPLSEPYSVPPASYSERRSSYGTEITSPLSAKPHERQELPPSSDYVYPESGPSYPGSYPSQHHVAVPGSVEAPTDMHLNTAPSYTSPEHEYHPPSVSQSEPFTPSAPTNAPYSFTPAPPEQLPTSKSAVSFTDSLTRGPEAPTYLLGRSTAPSNCTTTSSSAISSFGADTFPSSRDFFGQYFQDASSLPLTHPPLSGQEQRPLPPYQQQPLSALQHSNADFLRRASLMPGASYPSESLMGMTSALPQAAQHNWMSHEERSRHWPQSSPIIMPQDIEKAGSLARNPYSADYSFDPANTSSHIGKRTTESGFVTQTTSSSTDRYDLTSAYMSSRTFNPATAGNYARSMGASGGTQKQLEEAYRQAASHITDYRSIAQPPAMPDVYSRMGMGMGLDKYYYQREAMYRSPHALPSAPNPFMPSSSTAQIPGYTERDYARNAAAAAMYPQHGYSFMSDKQYLSAAVGNKVTQPPGPPTMPGAEYLQPPSATPTDMQDPYRRSVIYNMMPRYF